MTCAVGSRAAGRHCSADGGVNVAVFSAHAEAIEFCLFDEPASARPRASRCPARTGPVFHRPHRRRRARARATGCARTGRWRPARGAPLQPAKLLLDPYAAAFDRPFRLHPIDVRPSGGRTDDSAPLMPKAIVLRARRRRARRRQPVRLGPHGHLRAARARLHQAPPGHPRALRGTFAGLAHPAAIATLRRLGVTAVELMPAAAWIDERHLPRARPDQLLGLQPGGARARPTRAWRPAAGPRCAPPSRAARGRASR